MTGPATTPGDDRGRELATARAMLGEFIDYVDARGAHGYAATWVHGAPVTISLDVLRALAAPAETVEKLTRRLTQACAVLEGIDGVLAERGHRRGAPGDHVNAVRAALAAPAETETGEPACDTCRDSGEITEPGGTPRYGPTPCLDCDGGEHPPMTAAGKARHDAYFAGAGDSERAHDGWAQRRGFNSSGELHAWVDARLGSPSASEGGDLGAAGVREVIDALRNDMGPLAGLDRETLGDRLAGSLRSILAAIPPAPEGEAGSGVDWRARYSALIGKVDEWVSARCGDAAREDLIADLGVDGWLRVGWPPPAPAGPQAEGGQR